MQCFGGGCDTSEAEYQRQCYGFLPATLMECPVYMATLFCFRCNDVGARCINGNSRAHCWGSPSSSLSCYLVAPMLAHCDTLPRPLSLPWPSECTLSSAPIPFRHPAALCHELAFRFHSALLLQGHRHKR